MTTTMMRQRRRSPFRTAWALTRPYFFARGRRDTWLLVSAVVALNVLEIGCDVLLSDWNRRFFNAIQTSDRGRFFHEAAIFPLLVAALLACYALEAFAAQTLRLRWREWLTAECMKLWLRGQAYYRLRWTEAKTDNPDQRISEDVAIFVDKSVGLATSVLSSVLGLASFVFILWRLSGSLEIRLPLLGLVHIPGYLVWGALLYAALGTWFVDRVGRPLTDLEFQQERHEANFRFGLVRVRENAESIALYGGERVEREVLDTRFGALVANTRKLIRRRVALSATTNVYANAATLVPWMLAAGQYFAGKVKLGDVMQATGAFGQVRRHLSVIITNYASIATWRATVARIAEFASSVQDITDQASQPSQPGDDAPMSSVAIRLSMLSGELDARSQRSDRPSISVVRSDDDLRVVDVTTHTPEGDEIGARASFDVAAGERVLLSGPSGAGKTTLLRAVAGLWPHGAGRIERPSVRALFLSQRPYLPLGTLRDAICYPQSSGDVGDQLVRDVLRDVGLAAFAASLDVVAEWSHTLSLGEQQRVAFARVVLLRPELVVLDEATSALDEPAQSKMYALLRDRLPRAITLSVGHRASLIELHDRKVTLAAAQAATPR